MALWIAMAIGMPLLHQNLVSKKKSQLSFSVDGGRLDRLDYGRNQNKDLRDLFFRAASW